jgi:hypothetical protein
MNANATRLAIDRVDWYPCRPARPFPSMSGGVEAFQFDEIKQDWIQATVLIGTHYGKAFVGEDAIAVSADCAVLAIEERGNNRDFVHDSWGLD